MPYDADRILAPIIRRLDMMITRGVLRGTADKNGVQTQQVALLHDEVADDVERVQSYGMSAHPPTGGDALIAFVQGNRDHGMILAVNDRKSRPRSLKKGEVVIYNDQGVIAHLSEKGDLGITAKRNIGIAAGKASPRDFEYGGNDVVQDRAAGDGTVSWKSVVYTIEVDEGMTIKVGEGVSIDCQSITITAPNISLVGNVTITGNLEVLGNIHAFTTPNS